MKSVSIRNERRNRNRRFSQCQRFRVGELQKIKIILPKYNILYLMEKEPNMRTGA